MSKLPYDFEVKAIHRRFAQGRFKKAPYATTAPDPLDILLDDEMELLSEPARLDAAMDEVLGYDPRNHRGSRL